MTKDKTILSHTGICPICEKAELKIANESLLRGRKIIVCQNEKYRHVRVNNTEYICRVNEVVKELNLN